LLAKPRLTVWGHGRPRPQLGEMDLGYRADFGA